MRKGHWAFAVLCLGLSMAPPAIGQINPFRSGRSETRLTASDLALLEASVSQLNNDPHLAVGAQKDWSNSATGSHGQSVVTRIFSDGQHPCHQIRHEAYPLGGATARTYTLTWCRTPDGQWKTKS
jgi:surface antigen